jgi:hypothetical protein
MLAAGCSTSVGDLPEAKSSATATELSLAAWKSDIAHQKFAEPLSVGDAEQILLRTEFFETGVPQDRQVDAFNVLFDQSDALARFRAITAKGKPAGRLYALCALVALVPVEAHQLGAELGADHGTVPYRETDFSPTMTVAELAARIRRGNTLRMFREQKSTGGKSLRNLVR